MICQYLCAAFLIAGFSPGLPNSSQDEWSRFRGPNGSGVVRDQATYPEALNPEENLLWKVDSPPGYSSPVLTDDSIILTGYEGLELYTLCIDRESGDELWKIKAPKDLERPARPNSPVSSSAVTDGEIIVTFFGNFGLIAYDIEGEEQWRYPCEKFNNPYGMGSSPIMANGKVILQGDQDTDSYLLALESESGEEAWRIDRPGITHGFSTPVVYEDDKGKALLVLSSYEVAGYRLETGERLWWVTGLAWQAKSVPIVQDGVAYVNSWMAGPSDLGIHRVSGTWEETKKAHDKDDDDQLSKEEAPDESMLRLWFLFDLNKDQLIDEEEWEYTLARSRCKNGLYAIKLGGEKDVTESHVAWVFDRSLPNITSPAFDDGVLYLLKEGVLMAIDPEDGSILKRERLPIEDTAYFASPVIADGKIYTASQGGSVAVTRAGKDFEFLGSSALDGDIWGTPALSQGRVYVRTEKALYCFGDQDS